MKLNPVLAALAASARTAAVHTGVADMMVKGCTWTIENFSAAPPDISSPSNRQ